MKTAAFLIALLFAVPAAAQENLELPKVRLDVLQDEARSIDLTAPALLTAAGGLGVVGGAILAIASAGGGFSFGGLGGGLGPGGGGSQPNDLMLGSGIALAAVGLLVMIPSAIWLRIQNERLRDLDREFRRLTQGLSFSAAPDRVVLSFRGTF
jgi:hypothetical protein